MSEQYEYLHGYICRDCGINTDLANYRCEKTKLTFVFCNDCMEKIEDNEDNSDEHDQDEEE